jgi:ADP-heptose:LPS heptosyltransferase
LTEVKKILFFADAQLGDLLLMTPALKAFKDKYPESKVTLLLLHRRYYSPTDVIKEITRSEFQGTSQVFLNSNLADEVFELDRQYIRSLKGIKRIKAELKCIGFLRKMKFDAMVCSFPQSRFIIWSFLSGCRVRIGQKRQPFSYLLTDTPDITAKEKGVLKYYCNLLKPLGVTSECGETVYKVTDAEKTAAKNLLSQSGIDLNRKIVCIHPGASEAYKIWPPVYFSTVINYIIDNNLAQVIICFNSYDKKAVEEIAALSKHSLIMFDIETIVQLASVISLCSLSLVNNSGPRHISAAVGVKSLSIFQKYDNGEWRIYDDNKHSVIENTEKCSVCFNNKCESKIKEGGRFGSECMWAVTPEKVIAKLNDIL